MKNLKLTKFAKFLLGTVALAFIAWGLYEFAPGLKQEASKTLEAMQQDDTQIDNVQHSDMLPLPSTEVSTSIQSNPRVIISGYAWNGQTSIIGANGGPLTTKGSLMEQYGVNLQITRQDWLSDLRNSQFKAIEQFDNGESYPTSDKAAVGIIIMGDGAPFYVSTMNGALAEKYGENKYHVEIVGAFGMSNGEDKLIGPKEWKTNPKSMEGSVISVVLGDGDWVTTLNYCFANGLKVNPSNTTYDPNAVNLYASADDDYINSAKELISSQLEGFTVELDEVVDGKLTGNKVKRTIDGCATWTPGDKMVFDALTGFTDIASTKDFPNQMATTLIMFKEWAQENPDIVSNILKGAYTASNQIKQYDQWGITASNAVAKTFGMEDGTYWNNMFKGQSGSKDGLEYNMGGTRVLTYADAMQYYGITDGVNRYKSVYNQVSTYLTDMNPFGFNEAVKNGVTPYSEAINLSYLKNINDVDAGSIEKTDYTVNKTEVMASGEWYINFNVGSDEILSSSDEELETIYNLMIQAEQTKLSIIGHTDNTGSNEVNNRLSNERAQSVVNYLTTRGINKSRIQEVDGRGSVEPIADNSTSSGRRQNRRVQITLLQ